MSGCWERLSEGGVSKEGRMMREKITAEMGCGVYVKGWAGRDGSGEEKKEAQADGGASNAEISRRGNGMGLQPERRW